MAIWSEVQEDYESSASTIKEIAEKHDVKIGTLKSRISREKWVRGIKPKVATSKKKVATKKKKVATSKKKVATKKKKVATQEKDATLKVVTVEAEELNDRQRLFCLYYTRYFNATKAYQKAYEAPYGVASSNGSRMMGNAKIIAEIDRIKKEQTHDLKLTFKDILQKYIDIAFADITDFTTFGTKEVQASNEFGPVFDDDGKPVMVEVTYVEFKESTEVDGTIITEVKKGKDGVSVKLADKMKALDMLSKYFDLLSENDRKKLQDEKLRVDIAKGNAEVEKITDGDSNEPIEIVISRKGGR